MAINSTNVKKNLKAMSKFYQFILLLSVVLFFAGCGGTSALKDSTQKTGKETDISSIDDTLLGTMSSEEKIRHAEKLFASSLSKGLAEKNTLLSNALFLCSEVLTSYQPLSPEQLDYTLQLNSKIMANIDLATLNPEQKNQYLLATAAVKLSNYQASITLELLAQNFDSSQAKQWALYHKLRAMAQFQLGQKSTAVHELIIRHGYLSAEQMQQENQNLIWKYLATFNSNELNSSLNAAGQTESDRTYSGWLDLEKIFRANNDPQTMNHATNFWLQTYSGHQADRAFINRIIQARQESRLNLQHIAVLLPLQGKLAKPAKAIRDGIMASHYQSPLTANIQLRFYDTSNPALILSTYQQAIDNGAEFVIGPLAKSNLSSIIESAELQVPTLVLNSVENSTPERKPDNLFQFGLSPEAEARMVAEKGRKDGHYYAAIMAPDNSWGKRMKKAFAEHWEKSGGIVVELVDYPAKSHDFSESITAMLNIDQSLSRKKEVSRTIGRKLEFTPRRRQDIDMLFMAAFPRQAKQIPLQVIYHHGETIPIYSTAHIVANYHNAKQNIDMDGVYFSDMPFLLGAAENSASQQNTYQSTLYKRLFALGVDSYQLAPFVNFLFDNSSESFAGDTGQITINSEGHIIRVLPWATFKKGNVLLENITHRTDHAAVY